MMDDNDWRLHGVVSVEKIAENASGDNSQSAVVVDPIRLDKQRTLAFPIPNATAMMLNTSRKTFQDAQGLLQRESLRFAPRGFVTFETNAEAINFAELMTVSVISAHTSLECFANEWIAPWLTYKHRRKQEDVPKVLNKEAMERMLTLQEKFSTILPSVFRVKSPKGTTAWEHFVELVRLRDRLVHMKQADRQPKEIGTDTIWTALFRTRAPYASAKQMIDWFMSSAPYVPGLVFNNLQPVRPRWHVEWKDGS
ncbi:hypothetical protein PGB34_17795 [Xenophilus arseniciresistens]|uniref:Uncharacterized protein n=1 Tax=Xenophilus arseniciresistens TaxID=1283306 RepID=A0AAE3T2B7_9BURK|nr:hypothetical protein [Xenophilus arseniciresistens]MDA7418222.1 hypothetical protein [Xenophilus arseniciresistens]